MRPESEQSGQCAPRIISPPNGSQVFQRVFVDFTVFIILGVPILCLYLVGAPYHRGFNCGDQSIRYPFLENTISTGVLYIYATFIPLVVICINEYFVMRAQCSNFEVSMSRFWKGYFWQLYLFLAPFIFAVLASQLITDIAKYSIGRLRPHFIDLCKPKFQGVTLYRDSECKFPLLPETYIIDYVCTNEQVGYKLLRDIHLSFMSGHSSFCAVGLVYLVFYIQLRVRWSQLGLLKPLFQCLLVCLVLYTGFSRISDYKHHWSDVLTGLAQGTLVAMLVVFYVSDLHKQHTFFRSRKLNSAGPNSNQNRESGV